MSAVAHKNCFDHIALFAKEKTPDIFKLVSNVGSWVQYAGGTDGVHPLGKAAGTVAGALDIPATITNLHTLVKTINGEGAKPGLDPARQVVGDVTTFVESCSKAIKWTLGFFKDAVTAPWTALANGCGMYNCIDQGLRQVKDLTKECDKASADKNACRVASHAFDIAKFTVGFFLNLLSFVGVVAGVMICSPVMLVLSSVAIVCTFTAFFFKQEANNPRV
jgi:hypothetical protein